MKKILVLVVLLVTLAGISTVAYAAPDVSFDKLEPFQENETRTYTFKKNVLDSLIMESINHCSDNNEINELWDLHEHLNKLSEDEVDLFINCFFNTIPQEYHLLKDIDNDGKITNRDLLDYALYLKSINPDTSSEEIYCLSNMQDNVTTYSNEVINFYLEGLLQTF